MHEKKGIHCFVRGKVQGVWFRVSTQEEAENRKLTGWVKNLADGRVEVLAFGEPLQLEQLHQWLKKGPPRAEVLEVIYEEMPWEAHERFAIK